MTEPSTDDTDHNPKYREGDVIEVHESVARRLNNILTHEVVRYSPLAEEYTIREKGGARHHKVTDGDVHRLVERGGQRLVDTDTDRAGRVE